MAKGGRIANVVKSEETGQEQISVTSLTLYLHPEQETPTKKHS